MKEVVKSVAVVTAGILFVSLWLATGTFAEDIPDVVINELAWAGSSTSSQDEWIELKNVSDAKIDISSWQVTKNTGEEQLIIAIPEGSTIPAGGYFLIGNFDAANSVLAIEPDLVDASITLSNTALQIGIYSGDFTDPQNLADSAGDGGAPPAGNNSTKSSMERNSDLNGWHDAVSAINLDTGIIDLGTPAAENSVLVPPPTLESVLPTETEPGETLEVEEIRGTNFSIEPPPTIQLTLGDKILTGSEVSVVNDTLIDYVKFNISGAAAGNWDLVLTNPDGKSAVLPDAITILEEEPEYDLTTTVRINEIYPRPSTTSNDEFIELYNFGGKAINLTGWQLDDVQNGGSSPHTFAGVIIGTQSFVVIYKPASKLTLNDSGDSVYLIQPNGFVLDTTSYSDALRGETLARFSQGWKWTETPTPNGQNVLTQTEEPPLDDELEPEDEPEDTADEEVKTKTYKPGSMLLTEVLPNPSDGEEFIELFNNSNEPINLKGWQLQDASGKKCTIGESDITIQSAASIEPGQYVLVVQSVSKISLNNTGGEKLWLLDPSGTVIDAMSYPDKAPVGVTYAFDSDGEYWTWADVSTPGAPNIIILADEPVEEVIDPTAELVSSGPLARQWGGITLVSFGLTAMLFWYWKEKYAQRNSNRYRQLVRHLQTG